MSNRGVVMVAGPRLVVHQIALTPCALPSSLQTMAVTAVSRGGSKLRFHAKRGEGARNATKATSKPNSQLPPPNSLPPNPFPATLVLVGGGTGTEWLAK